LIASIGYSRGHHDSKGTKQRTTGCYCVLSKYNVKSTFFLTGESVSAFPESAREILQYGHEIGNHSYSHPQLNQLSVASIESEIKKCENAIKNATNRLPVSLFRPPYGEYNSTVLNVVGDLGYQWTIMWTIDTLDWAGTSSNTIIQNVLNNAKPGAIVLMHVSGTHSVEALPRIIEGLKAKGYTLTTISSMLSLPINPPQGKHLIVKYGNTGEEVKKLQQILSNLGYSPGPIDGVFGPQTDKAVRAYQSANKLVVDGIVGNNTWTALDAGQTAPQVKHSILRYGNTGEEVRKLQQTLSNLGYSPGPIDGIFGPQTDKAVRSFQSANGLLVDGIVGKNTWVAIDNVI